MTINAKGILIKRLSVMKPIDLSRLYKKYEGKWVALTKFTNDYEVICSGEKMEEVHKKALRKGYESPVMFKVSPKLKQVTIM